MARYCLFFLSLSLLVVGSLSDEGPNCSAMRIRDDDYDDDHNRTTSSAGVHTSPTVGDATVNSICSLLKGKAQCCSADYFNAARDKLKNQDLKNGLGVQARPQLDGFRSLAYDVDTYYRIQLNIDISDNFNNISVPNATTYNMNPTVDKFNGSDFVFWIIRGVIEFVKRRNNVNTTCIEAQAMATLNANKAALVAFARDIAAVRNASTLFLFIKQFLLNVTNTVITKVPPSDQCTNILLRLTCGKCQMSIPPLCNSLCNAAAKGCFAPYFTALNPQFNILWNVTTQLIQFLNTTLTDMFLQQNTIRQALVNDWIAKCNVTIDLKLGGNIRPQGVGVGFLRKAQALLNSGLLAYNGTVSVCASKTSRSRCWNGDKRIDQDGDDNNNGAITGQANNTAGSFNETQLTNDTRMIGLPVNEFFNSTNVAMVIPAAITIPQGQVFTGSPSGSSTGSPTGSPTGSSTGSPTGSPTGSAAAHIVPLLLMLFLALLVFAA